MSSDAPLTSGSGICLSWCHQDRVSVPCHFFTTYPSSVSEPSRCAPSLGKVICMPKRYPAKVREIDVEDRNCACSPIRQAPTNPAQHTTADVLCQRPPTCWPSIGAVGPHGPVSVSATRSPASSFRPRHTGSCGTGAPGNPTRCGRAAGHLGTTAPKPGAGGRIATTSPPRRWSR